MRERGVPAEKAAHFLMRLLFCLFSEDIGLLPPKLFSRLVENSRRRPAEFTVRLRQLFTAMANEHGSFGEHDIPFFNGGLFADDEAFDLSEADMAILAESSGLDWSSIEPAIFGVLFERSLDPDKRSQLGAHYTSKDDILLIVEPVLMAPLQRRWHTVQQAAQEVAEKARKATGAARTKHQRALSKLLQDFLAEVSQVRVLDPACGSGNFLYLALKRLLDLEKEVSVFAASNGLSGLLPRTDPSHLYGIETNPYAHELASVVVWIGYIQWQHENGYVSERSPILRPLQNIRRMDAVLAYDAKGKPAEPEWPEADVIISNPPFLGDKKMRAELGDKYVDDLRALYEGRVPGGADLVTYWFERARAQIEAGRAKRAGLLATNSIRMVGNRAVLERIKETGDIFMAWSDREWVLEGANVRVSLIGYDEGEEKIRVLDGKPVENIHADLSASHNFASAARLPENNRLCFLGMMKAGPFDLSEEQAQQLLSLPLNPNGRPNSDVVKPRLGGKDVTGRARRTWVVDFGVDTAEKEAALYELPFEHVRRYVLPVRSQSRRTHMREKWWIHGEARPGLRRALSALSRCIVTPEVAKHRLFVWMDTRTVPDHKLHVIAREDDYFMGVLHSRPHELWALRLGSTLEDRPSYNSDTTFTTFPFPWPPGTEPQDDPRVQAIADAARELVSKRDAWLNPPGTSEDELKRRTLTRLYNERPAWLADLHAALDRAVLAAYGWPAGLSDAEILERLLKLNQKRVAVSTMTAETAG